MLFTREFSIDAKERSEEEGDSLVVDLAMASETPVERWYGLEVLRISPETVRTDRLNDGASLLFNHDWDDLRGVHVKGTVRVDADKVLRGKVRIEGATSKGKETVALVRGEYLTKSSVGYRIHRVIEKRTQDDGTEVTREIPGDVFVRSVQRCEATGNLTTRALCSEFRRSVPGYDAHEDDTVPTYEVIDFEPFENSLVTVPADTTVGVGRSASVIPFSATAASAAGVGSMSNQDNAAAGASADIDTRIEAGRQAADANFAAENEKRRVTAIRALAQANKIGEDTVQTWITRGTDLNQIADDILSIHKQRGESKPQSISALGLSSRETSQYSLCRAILAAHSNDWKNAGFELECHNAIAERSNKPQERGHFYVPLEVQRRSTPFDGQAFMERNGHNFGHLSRDLNVATAGAGGFLVQTSNASFDELLRNISFSFRMGATRLTGLRDNITIPRQSAAASAEWLTSETAAPTETQQQFVQLSMAPKTVGAYTELSRKLLLQASIDVEGLVNADLAAVAGLAVDAATVNGTGTSGQPLGILNVSGVGSVSGSSLGFAGILETQTDLAAGNVMPLRGGYVTTPAVAALMMAEVMFANTASPLWTGNIWNGNMMGFPAMSTNQMPSATMVFGDWSKLVVGEWGVLEIDTNPYASFAAGIIGVRALYSVDVGVRLPVAFTVASSIS